MKTPIAVLLIILALVVGAVAGFLYAESMEREEPEASAAAAVVNPFEETRVNPLEGAGYENPLEEVRFNPFE